MKKLNKYLYLFVASTFFFTACVDENEVNQERPGPVNDPRLDIVAVDASGAPVSGATVTIFGTADDYANEENPVAEATTGADGVASFSPADLNDEQGVYFINIASGVLRNWTSVTSTPYLYLQQGPTRIQSTLASVPQQFLDLVARDWQMTSYTYPGLGNIYTDANYPTCELDDVFRFRKDGVVIRFEGASSCASPTADQAPVSVEGSVWSGWALNDDASEITIRDLDPDWENGEVDAGLTTSDTQITIDYGGNYVATLTPN